MTTKRTVQLGFCEPIESEEQRRRVSHHSVTWWSDWDGGQVGGRPSWLNPQELPTSAAVYCTVCPNEQAMQFVCQLYAPLDDDCNDDDDNDAFEQNDDQNIASRTAAAVKDAFHRTLYVFACPHMTTHSDPTTTGLRVLRTQLPRDNAYWPLDETEEDDDSHHNVTTTWTRHRPERYHKNGLCVVCGFPATGQCPLQQQSFCGTAHQRLYKKRLQQQPTDANGNEDDDEQPNGNSNAPTTTTQSNLPGVYNMLELVVEEEPPAPSVVELNEKDGRSNQKSAPLYPTIDEDDSDEDLDQDDLNRIVTGKDSNSKKKREEDATYQRFVARWTERANCKGQVLRYCRWPTKQEASDKDDVGSNGPLWIRSDHQPDQIPTCPYCGAERKFEFQLMPQMLHYLTNTVGATSKSSSSKNETPPPVDDYESVKAAVQLADSLVQQAPPEQIPPALMEAKTAAVARLREQLLRNGTKANLDWGIVAVYTCTRSCSTTTFGKDYESQANEATKRLGAYREEFTWRQPAIDDDKI